MLEETNASGVAQADYIYLDGRPVAVLNGSTLYYLHDDMLGAPQVATDSNQAVAWQASYDPFGQASVSGTVTQNLRLPGQYFDVESGWNHNGFRDYAPALGRYAEPDPLGRLGSGNNLYAYVGDNPVNLADPLGLCPECQQQNAGASASKGGTPVTLTLNLGGVKVKVTYTFGSIFSNYLGGMQITADPQNCDGCTWAQVFSRTGAGATSLTQDGAGIGPLYGQENPNVPSEFYDTPANTAAGTFNATALVGAANIGGKSFSATGAMTYGYSINGSGCVTMTTAPRVATPREMNRAIQLLQSNSPAWQIQ
ncbi:MAG: RHS repeat-associated core domain-containing protein [Terracidiphilus sp.]